MGKTISELNKELIILREQKRRRDILRINSLQKKQKEQALKREISAIKSEGRLRFARKLGKAASQVGRGAVKASIAIEKFQKAQRKTQKRIKKGRRRSSGFGMSNLAELDF